MASNVTSPAPIAHDGLPRGPVSAQRHPQSFHFIQSRAMPVKIRPSDSVTWSYFPDTHAAAIALTEREFFSSVHTAEASIGKTLKSESKRSDGLIIKSCTIQDVIENNACEHLKYQETGNPSRTFCHASWSSAYRDSFMQLNAVYSSSNALGKAVTKKLCGSDIPGLRKFQITHVTRKTQPIELLRGHPEITYDAPYRIRDDSYKVSPPSYASKHALEPRASCAYKCRDKTSCLHACCKVRHEGSLPPNVSLPSPEDVAPMEPSLTSHRRPCKHTCRDKRNCLHKCCKVGVPITMPKVVLNQCYPSWNHP